jgi:hypothetical protein
MAVMAPRATTDEVTITAVGTYRSFSINAIMSVRCADDGPPPNE